MTSVPESAADYERRAREHAPRTLAELHAEVRRLAGENLKARDIAAALRMNVADVVNILASGAP